MRIQLKSDALMKTGCIYIATQKLNTRFCWKGDHNLILIMTKRKIKWIECVVLCNDFLLILWIIIAILIFKGEKWKEKERRWEGAGFEANLGRRIGVGPKTTKSRKKYKEMISWFDHVFAFDGKKKI